MTTLPAAILAVLQPFAIIFRQHRVFCNATILFMGAILCTGKVTVCSALRALGLSSDRGYSRFHRLLNRNHWNMLLGAKILLLMLIAAFSPDVLRFAVDDTIERRRGKKIRAKGIFKDPLGTGTGKQTTCTGLRWVPVMLLLQVPFMRRTLALPFLIPLSISERTATKLGRRHKSPQRLAGQICCLLRRWLPHRHLILVADAGYTTAKLFRTCQRLNIQLVTRAKSNLRFFHLPPPRSGKRGRPCIKGQRLPSLKALNNGSDLQWQSGVIDGYSGAKDVRRFASLECLWDSVEEGPILVRLVFVKDSHEDSEAPVFCLITSAPMLSLEQIVGLYGMRWSQEVTHREAREYLGVESQRQWSDLAIERSTPILFCMYSLIFLIHHHLQQTPSINSMQAAWYQKTEPTFSDLIHTTREQIREQQLLAIWSRHPILNKIQCPQELLCIFKDLGMAA